MAAASLLIVAAPLVTLLITDSSPGTPPVAGSPESSNIKIDPTAKQAPTEDPKVLDGPPVAGGVGGPLDATVTLLATRWGTQIEMELRGAIGPRRSELFAISRAGEARVVTGWSVPPGGSEPLKLAGGSPFQPSQIERLEVRDDEGNILLVLPT
jgi:hypothetical protein